MSRLSYSIFAVLVTFVFVCPNPALACAKLFSAPDMLTPAQRYVGLLKSMQVPVTTRAKLVLALNAKFSQGRVVNPIDFMKNNHAGMLPLRQAFDVILSQPDFDISELSQLMSRVGAELDQSLRRDKETYGITLFPFRPAEYAMLPSESFPSIDVNNAGGRLELPYKIEVSTSPVTPGHYFEITGKIHALDRNWQKEDNALNVLHDGKVVQVFPDHRRIPSADVFDVFVYLNLLSIRNHLKPVYVNEQGEVILSEIADRMREKIVSHGIDYLPVFIDAPNQDVALAEGYRLPNILEDQYLLVSALRAVGVLDSELSLITERLVLNNVSEPIVPASLRQSWSNFKVRLVNEMPFYIRRQVETGRSGEIRDAVGRFSVWSDDPVLIGAGKFHAIFDGVAEAPYWVFEASRDGQNKLSWVLRGIDRNEFGQAQSVEKYLEEKTFQFRPVRTIHE